MVGLPSILTNFTVGTVGCSSSQEYAVVGDIVNLSARLMVASYKGQHGILCDSQTNDIAGKSFNTGKSSNFVQGAKFHFKELEPIMVKGKSDPIEIFLPQKPEERLVVLAITLTI